MKALRFIFKEIREANRLTQTSLSAKMNKTQSAYTRMETGKTAITFEDLQIFAKVFEMSLIDVITYPEKWIPSNLQADQNNANTDYQGKINNSEIDYLKLNNELLKNIIEEKNKEIEFLRSIIKNNKT